MIRTTTLIIAALLAQGTATADELSPAPSTIREYECLNGVGILEVRHTESGRLDAQVGEFRIAVTIATTGADDTAQYNVRTSRTEPGPEPEPGSADASPRTRTIGEDQVERAIDTLYIGCKMIEAHRRKLGAQSWLEKQLSAMYTTLRMKE